MPIIDWLIIPHPRILDNDGWGENPWGVTPWGDPTTSISGMGQIDWVEITNETEGE